MKTDAATDSTRLTSLSASEMARQIAAGAVSSAEVVEAHIRRIEAVNPRLNAVVVARFDAARAEAAAADLARDRGEPLGPLHGVPITVKECFHLAGTPSTEGIGRFADELLASDGALVRRLRRAGAIVLGKTNLPQLMFLHETDNPVYGRTNNPWSAERGPGGSSGGEASIIAAGGSPLGLANDIGGSIRHPAHSCGICGLKPTTLRLTNADVRDNLRGMEAIRPVAGPLARSVEDLHLALGVLLDGDENEIDAQAAPVPLGDPSSVRINELRVGMWSDDGFFPAAPAIRRAVGQAADVLRRLGAHVEAFQPPDVAGAVDLFFSLLSADGGADVGRILARSPRDWRIRRLLLMARAPAAVRLSMAAAMNLAGQRRTGRLLRSLGRRSADGYWQLAMARQDYAERFFAAWSAARLDAMICPPHTLPALRHGSTEHLASAASYCFWANVLGVPAGVVPATRVAPGEESDRSASYDLVERAARAVEAGSAGLPVGVQVAARPWREDVVLAIMAALEAEFKNRPDFPQTPVTPG